jgi:hypothetical protein
MLFIAVRETTNDKLWFEKNENRVKHKYYIERNM